MNPFETEARTRKVNRLLDTIETLAIASGSNPYSHPAVMARVLREQPRELWDELARRAGVNAPSAATISEVIGNYERRARARLQEAR